MHENIIRGEKLINFKQESMGKKLLEALQNGGNKIAMINGYTGEEITYKEMLQKSISLAQHLSKMGLKKGNVIAVCGENSINFLITSLAATYLGVTIAAFSHFYTEREMKNAINIAKPKLIFCSASVFKTISSTISDLLTPIYEIILLNKNANVPRTVISIESLFNLPISDNFEVTPVEMDHGLSILYSSGTTGLPKGVSLTHFNYNAALEQMKHPRFGNFNSSKTALLVLPFYHTYAFSLLLLFLATNLKFIFLSQFEERLFLKSIEKYKVTFLPLVPPLLLFLIKNPLVKEYDISSLKNCFCGAAPLSNNLKETATKRLNVLLQQGYGLTESTLATNFQPVDQTDNSSIGLLLPGLEGKVIDRDTGKVLGPYEIGELCFKGCIIMKEYVGNQKATSDTIKNGWLYTGDAGYYDDIHHFYIIDRFKELIKYKGFQVPPAEIEGILLKHPDILDCGVVGKPDEETGELPVAFVVKRANAKITQEDIINYVSKHVSKQKRLHGVIFLNNIPKNPSGKVLRRVLRDRFNTQSKL